MKKLLLAALCLCCAFILTACSKSPNADDLAGTSSRQASSTLAASDSAALVPKAINYELPDGIVSVTGQCRLGGELWLGGFGKEGVVLCHTDLNENSGSFVLPESIEFIYALCGQGDNLVVLCGSLPVSYYDADGILTYSDSIAGELELLTISQDGTIISQAPLRENYDDATMRFKLMYELEGSYFISCQSTLIKLSSDGTEFGRISIENSTQTQQFFSICMYDGKLVACISELLSTDSQLWIIDPLTFEVVEKLDFPGHSIIGAGVDETGNLLINTRTALFSFDAENKTLEEILSWEQLYVTYQNFAFVEQVSGKYLFYQPYEDSITTVEYLPQDSSRIELTLATDVAYGEVYTLVNNFNTSQDEVQINIKVYNEDNLPMELLLTEISAGHGPDIFAFTMDESLGQVKASSLYVDLFTLLDEDPEYDRTDIVPNLLSAMTENDALYWLPCKFNILTFVAPESLIDNPGISLAESEAILIELGDKYTMLPKWVSPEFMLNWTIKFSSGNFIDSDAGTCNFDSPEFIALLELCKEWTHNDEDYSAEDKYLMCYEPLPGLTRLSGLSSYMGGDYCFVGFPTGSENGSTFLIPLKLAISRQSEYISESYEFLRYTLSDEGQAIASGGVEFCATQSALQNSIDNALAGELILAGMEWKISESDVEKFWALLNSTDTVSSAGAEFDIMWEAASAYFYGTRTAQEAAEIIQSRMRIYLAERS